MVLSKSKFDKDIDDTKIEKMELRKLMNLSKLGRNMLGNISKMD